MENDVLTAIYVSYVDRIKDFRTEQDRIVIVLTGLFAIISGAVIQANTILSAVGNAIFIFVSILSAALHVMFLNHSFMIMHFATLIRHLESLLRLPPEVCFYSRTFRARTISYFVSLLLPFFLYIGITSVFIVVALTPPILYSVGLLLHTLIVVVGFVVLYRAYYPKRVSK